MERRTIKGVPVVALVGDVDRAHARILTATLVDPGVAPQVVHGCRLLDLSRLRFADSTIIALVYDILDTLPEDAWLGLIGASAGVLKVLRLAGLTEQNNIRLFPSAQEAERAL